MKLVGFKNYQASCYADALLMAIFAPYLLGTVSKAPEPGFTDTFWTVFIERPVTAQGPDATEDRVCHPDPAVDLEIRQSIQAALREEIQKLEAGQRSVCRDFRRLLGSTCRRPGSVDLGRGMNDPVDLYERLMEVYGPYLPMTVEEKTMYRQQDNPHDYVTVGPQTVRRSTVQANVSTILRENRREKRNDLHLGWYPRNYRRLPEPVILFRGTSRQTVVDGGRKDLAKVVDASVFVVNVIRGHGMSRDDRVRMNFSPVTVPDMYTAGKDGKRFQLQSAVIHTGADHYTALVRRGEEWWMFDDLRPRPEEMSSTKANQLIARQSVMLFYFPQSTAIGRPEKRSRIQEGPSVSGDHDLDAVMRLHFGTN